MLLSAVTVLSFQSPKYASLLVNPICSMSPWSGRALTSDWSTAVRPRELLSYLVILSMDEDTYLASYGVGSRPSACVSSSSRASWDRLTSRTSLLPSSCWLSALSNMLAYCYALRDSVALGPSLPKTTKRSPNILIFFKFLI